jgi:1,4-dihydroxy-2-naphthoyl-CoA hydrolase
MGGNDQTQDKAPRDGGSGPMSGDEMTARNRWGTGMGIEVLERSSQRVRARIVVDERHHQPYGIAHGGVYCSIVEDIASQGAGLAAMEAGAAGVVGINNNTDFLRSHSAGELTAVAEPLHIGRSTMLWQVWIRRSTDDKPVARGQVRFHVLTERPEERRRRLDGQKER